MKKTQDGSNSVIHSERRRLLIDATISAISEHGLSKVTLAKIAQIAGLTAGSVNFHFDSKELLLLEVDDDLEVSPVILMAIFTSMMVSTN